MLTLPALVFRKFTNLVISFYIQPQCGKKSITNEKYFREIFRCERKQFEEKKALKPLTGELILITFKIPTFYHIG